MIVALFDCDGTLFSAQFGRGLIEYANDHSHKGLVRAYYSSLLVPYVLRKLTLFPEEPYSRLVMKNLAWLIKGWSEKEAQAAFDWVVHEYLLPTGQSDIISRLKDHQAKGHKIVLVSAQFLPALNFLKAHFNADGVVGTQLKMHANRYTGQIIPPVNTGEDKNMSVRQFFNTQNVEVDWDSSYAYADSFTDLGLFRLVGNPIAVYPDAKLNTWAFDNGWEIIGTPKG